MKKTIFLVVLITTSMLTNVLAQKAPMKFDKIDKLDLEMKTYEKDTSAAAVILCDYGRSYFIYTERDGFQVVFEHHRRIKILKKSGYNWADVAIKYYRSSDGSREKVSAIKANTYNLIKGKLVKDKLSKKAQFNEEINKYWSAVKFTMPNVKEGSIIEYKYSVKSDFVFNYRDWQFQYSIPVRWSEYSASIPEFFHYNKTVKGYEPLAITDKNRINKKFTYTIASKNREGLIRRGESTRTGTSQSDFEVLTDIHRWVATDMPGFKEEAFMTTKDNYLSKIEFELASTKFPNSMRKDYTNTWESINKQLMDNESFGHQFSGETFAAGSGFVKDEIDRLKNNYNDEFERMKGTFDYVKNYMKWNGYNGKYVNTSLRKAHKDKSGNVGDINLLLTMMLAKVGLEAVPVILSTRNNGRIYPTHPSVSQFNYVVAKVEIGGKRYLLDATDPLNPINMLPYRCLNDKGRSVSSSNSDWVDLYGKIPKKTLSMYDFSISEEGVIAGKCETSRSNYAAYEFRKALESADSQEDFIEDIEKNNNGLEITKHKFENLDDLDKPINEAYEVTIRDQAEAFGDMIYFNPLLYDQMKNNPFKLDERKFPVDYGYVVHETNIYKYKIPEGYTLEEKPANMNLALPDKAARFAYSVTEIGNVIQVTCTLNINKTLFLPDEYQSLKKFYSQAISKQAEQIILKKQSE